MSLGSGGLSDIAEDSGAEEEPHTSTSSGRSCPKAVEIFADRKAGELKSAIRWEEERGEERVTSQMVGSNLRHFANGDADYSRNKKEHFCCNRIIPSELFSR